MINIEQMRADNIQSHLIFLAEMASASQFEKIAMGIRNPQIFSQFIALVQDAVVWDYAYAAGLITKAEADLMKSYEIPVGVSSEEAQQPPVQDAHESELGK